MKLVDTIDLPIYATADDGGLVLFQATGLPIGLSIDANTGIISGTIKLTLTAPIYSKHHRHYPDH